MATKLTALYYPHITLDNERLLKNALILWDQVELICPFPEFPHLPADGTRRAAFCAIAKPLRPSVAEMRNAHEALIEIADSPLPNWFFPEHAKNGGSRRHLHYSLHPEKLLPETWEELRRSKLAEPVLTDIEPPIPRAAIRREYNAAKQKAYATTQAFGLTILAVLADCCAGDTRQLMTDEVNYYVALNRYLKLISGATAERGTSTRYDRLVTLSFTTLNVSGVSLQALTAIRSREKDRPHLRQMRHAYLQKLDTYVARLSTAARRARDVREIEREFLLDVSDDVALLKEELKDEAKKVIFSKEMGATAIALAGTFVEPIMGSLLAAGALYRSKVEYRAARNRTLERHAMAWLYETRGLTAY
jgi:hypothetical protein